MQCILPQSLTTPDRLLGNPLTSKGFCNAHEYRHVIDRCNNGHDSLSLNIEIHNELVEIFKTFSESISKWTDRSKKRISNSKESSTTKQAWRECIVAVKKHVDRNNAVAEEVEKKVIRDLSTFKNKYGKCLVGVQKSRDFESKFKRHQKPWLKTVEEINENKDAYLAARRKLTEAKDAEEASKRDVSSTDEEKRKATHEVERREKKLESYKRKYHSSIDGIDLKQSEYEKDMLRVLKETDDFERERLTQVQTSFTALKSAFLIETDKYLTSLSEEFDKAMKVQKIDDDLVHFDRTYGSQTTTEWPKFEAIKD